MAAHALEGMTEAIVITSADGTILTVNHAFTQLTGHTRDDVLGRAESAIRNALQPAEFYDEVYLAVRASGYWTGTTWARRKNGSVYREWRSIRAVKDTSRAPSPTTSWCSTRWRRRAATGRSATEPRRPIPERALGG